VRILARDAPRVSVISFTMEGVHPHDIGTIVDLQGVAIRAGHHCAQPLMDRFGVPATARASLSFYNTREEIETLVSGLHQVNEVFGR
jgi:cysteine desulfurase/selenocysteine lyase